MLIDLKNKKTFIVTFVCSIRGLFFFNFAPIVQKHPVTQQKIYSECSLLLVQERRILSDFTIIKIHYEFMQKKKFLKIKLEFWN